jgi:hypothetical protein
MKPILSVFILSFMVCFFAQGQTKQPAKQPTASGDCFKQWYSLFKERGANAVSEGVNDVIITLRNADYSECFMGRIEVTNGRISGKLQIQKVDGSYAEFDKRVSASYQNAEGTLKEDLRDVINGMSASVALSDGEFIRLFFYKTLAEKPVANKKAPAPSVLVKN